MGRHLREDGSKLHGDHLVCRNCPEQLESRRQLERMRDEANERLMSRPLRLTSRGETVVVVLVIAVFLLLLAFVGGIEQGSIG